MMAVRDKLEIILARLAALPAHARTVEDVLSGASASDLNDLRERLAAVQPEIAVTPIAGAEERRVLCEKLREALSGAVHVTFGDSAEQTLAHTLSEPDQGLLLVVEQAWEQQLVDRCAHAVEYEAHEI